jgi:ribosome-associated protein
MKKHTFSLKGAPYVEMIKLLKLYKLVGSGGEAKVRIDNGEATRNGEVELRKRAKIVEGEIIVFDGNSIKVTQ